MNRRSLKRIGVLSDTHIPNRAKELPLALLKAFENVDHIIHAGDVAILDVILQLEKLAPVTAVAGNIDPPELRGILREKNIEQFGSFHIGVFHGHGSKGNTVSRALDCFHNDEVDCIIFGHSHIPYMAYHDHILLFNPGSPTDKRRNERYSFGIIEIDGTLTANHVFF
jgi:putative phosphoesterase